jgi:hypothetical protein
VFSLVVGVVAVSVFAQSADMYVAREAAGAKSFAAAPRLSDVEPAVTLGAAPRVVPDQLDALEQWNLNHVPTRTGFSRRLGGTLAVRINPTALSKGERAGHAGGVMSLSNRGIVWSGAVKVEGAYQLRLHLENVKLPEGAVLWVWGDNEPAIAFDKDLIDPRGAMWTPITAGENIHLEIEVPSGSGVASFDLNEVMQIVALQNARKPVTNDEPTCLRDVQCRSSADFAPINLVKKAIGQMVYTKSADGASYVCTGSLLNDTSSSGTPYFLTANHCIQDQAEASSLEVHWDFMYADCTSTTYPPLSTFQRSNGSTLLAQATGSDFCFVRLNAIPSGRSFLGWTASATATPSGTKLFRISHPAPSGYGPQPQQFSTTTVNTSVNTCGSWPRSSFVYSSTMPTDMGGTYGGSSGSAVMLADGKVVGQLAGGCTTGPGQDPAAGCDARISTTDGAFATTFSSISSFLTGNPAQPSAPCLQNATTLCVMNNRFAVSATYRTNDSNGTAQAVRMTADTGYFWFFNSSNVEVVVKGVDACGFNQRFWIFAAGLTNVNVVITVRDSKTGTVKTYTNPLNTAFAPVQDTGAFATCP